MAELTAEMILAANDQKDHLKKVDVPEWGGEVYIRAMTAGERDAHEIEWMQSKDRGVADFRSKLLVRVLSNSEGKRLFTDEQVKALRDKSAAVVNRLWGIAMKVNAMTEKDVEALAGE
jgi:hypothetical protein